MLSFIVEGPPFLDDAVVGNALVAQRTLRFACFLVRRFALALARLGLLRLSLVVVLFSRFRGRLRGRKSSLLVRGSSLLARESSL